MSPDCFSVNMSSKVVTATAYSILYAVAVTTFEDMLSVHRNNYKTKNSGTVKAWLLKWEYKYCITWIWLEKYIKAHPVLLKSNSLILNVKGKPVSLFMFAECKQPTCGFTSAGKNFCSWKHVMFKCALSASSTDSLHSNYKQIKCSLVTL